MECCVSTYTGNSDYSLLAQARPNYAMLQCSLRLPIILEMLYYILYMYILIKQHSHLPHPREHYHKFPWKPCMSLYSVHILHVVYPLVHVLINIYMYMYILYHTLSN